MAVSTKKRKTDALTVMLPKRLLADFRAYCKRNGLKKGHMTGQAIELWLKEQRSSDEAASSVGKS